MPSYLAVRTSYALAGDEASRSQCSAGVYLKRQHSRRRPLLRTWSGFGLQLQAIRGPAGEGLEKSNESPDQTFEERLKKLRLFKNRNGNCRRCQEEHK